MKTKALNGLCLAFLIVWTVMGSTARPVEAATIVVDRSTGSSGDANGCNLREAIATIQSGVDLGNGCGVGLPENTIVFDASLNGATINLTALTNIDADMTIDATSLPLGLTITGAKFRIGDNGASTVTLRGLTFDSIASPAGQGGAIEIRTTGTVVNIYDSTFTNNSSASTQDGGAVHVREGELNIYRSSFSGNFAGESGGAIFYNANTSGVLVNVTISGNSANNNGGGLVTNGAVTLFNVTIGPNTGDAAGAANTVPVAHNVYRGGGTLNVYNSLMAQEATGGPACYHPGGFDPVNGIDSNVITEDATCTLTGTGNQENVPWASVVDTNLVNGVHELLPSSMAMDAGDNATCNATDQRGVSRPQDGDTDGIAHCDIGAVEAIPQVCAVGTVSTYRFGGVEIKFDDLASTNLDCVRVEYVAGNHPEATSSAINDALETGRYWHINGLQSDGSTPATGSFQVDVTLPYADANFDSRACKWLEGAGSGFGWDCGTDSNTQVALGVSVTRVDYTGGFSEWAAGDQVGPTAVTWQNTSATSGTTPVYGVWIAFVMLALLTIAVRIFNGIRTF